VRDSKLDLPTDEMEFRREHLDYPFSEVIRKGAVESLAVRTRVPNGFTNCVFECLDVLQTNGLSIPLRTRFSCYWRDHRQEGHVRLVKYEEYSLTVEKVEILEGGTLPEIVAPGSALVYDFRYAAANGRTKYNHATYCPKKKTAPASKPPARPGRFPAWSPLDTKVKHWSLT
jgi:hypothetical protein